MDRSQEWTAFGEQVLDAVRGYFTFRAGKGLPEPATLLEERLATDADGVAVAEIIYDHSSYKERLGLRRRLDSGGGLHADPKAMGEQIAQFDISAPLGRYYDLLVEDENHVWWWGDGCESLATHADFKHQG